MKIIENNRIRGLYYLLSYPIYVILNEIFFHIGLIFSEKRIVVYPYLTGSICQNAIGYDSKLFLMYVVFLISKLLFIILISRNKYIAIKFPHYKLIISVFLITGFLHVILCLIQPKINWEAYFYCSFPTFQLKVMSGYPNWIFMFLETTITVGLFSYLNKITIKNLITCFRYVPLSFLLYFFSIYFFLGFILKR